MNKPTSPKFHAQRPLSKDEELSFNKRISSFGINEQLIDFLTDKIGSVEELDKKLWLLFYAKKVLPYLSRMPDQDHFKAFEEDYLRDKLYFDPLKWIENEIAFLNNIKTLGNKKAPDQALLEAKADLSKQWLNRDEIMQLLSISRTTLNRRISEGMPCHPKGKSNFFNLEEVSEWLKHEPA